MSPRRADIAEPAVFQLSHVLQRPLAFMASDELPPVGPGARVTTSPVGNRMAGYPWGLEESLKQPGGSPAYMTRYVFPVTDVDFMLAYCVDHLLDAPHHLMAGRDYGDRVTALVAEHWPTTSELLVNGNDWDPTVPAVIRVVTSEAQWAVAVVFTNEATAPDEIVAPEATIIDLTERTMEMLGEALRWPDGLPGLLDAVGGPDLIERRMQNANSVVGLAGKVAGLIAKLN